MPLINTLSSLTKRIAVFLRTLLREVGPSSRRYLKWRTVAPVLAVLAGTVGCSICATTPYQNEVDACVAFEITSVEGLPKGPVVVKWSNGEILGPYFIGIGGTRVHGSGDAPAGATSATIQIDQAAAAQTVKDEGTFLISVSYPMQASGVDCTAYKEIGSKKSAQKQAPKPTATPTNPPPPPQQPPKNDKPKPTPCPPGYDGDPSKGETCIKIPT